MRLFVDTSAWVAYYDQRDRYHEQANAAMFSLRNRPALLFTTDYVLDEALTLLLYHAGREAALRFGEMVQRSRNTKLLRIDAEAWDEAWQWFKKYDDKVWAFTDCTSFATMKRFGLVQAFAFDHHFAQAGFQLWPGEV